MSMTVSNPNGYTEPVPGNLDDLVYNFDVKIVPCELTGVDKSSDQSISYELGDAGSASAA